MNVISYLDHTLFLQTQRGRCRYIGHDPECQSRHYAGVDAVGVALLIGEMASAVLQPWLIYLGADSIGIWKAIWKTVWVQVWKGYMYKLLISWIFSVIFESFFKQDFQTPIESAPWWISCYTSIPHLPLISFVRNTHDAQLPWSHPQLSSKPVNWVIIINWCRLGKAPPRHALCCHLAMLGLAQPRPALGKPKQC